MNIPVRKQIHQMFGEEVTEGDVTEKIISAACLSEKFCILKHLVFQLSAWLLVSFWDMTRIVGTLADGD